MEQPKGRSLMRLLLPLAVLLFVAVAAWYLLRDDETTVPVELEVFEQGLQSPAPTAVVRPEPSVVAQPSPQPTTTVETAEPEPTARPEPLPALGDSDPLVSSSLIAALGDGRASAWLPEDDIIRRISAFLGSIDGGKLSRKALKLPSPEGRFRVEESGGRLLLSERNYGRYEALLALLESVDMAAAAAWFDRFEPLLQTAWAELGSDDRGVRAALKRALQTAIDTPEISGSLDLVRPGVFYKYADPQLEALPDLQKLMLRIGPENRERARIRCRELLQHL